MVVGAESIIVRYDFSIAAQRRGDKEIQYVPSEDEVDEIIDAVKTIMEEVN